MPTKTEQKNRVAVRPPVVAVMGHIDHGKSTLLDYIRKTNITDKEAGGITQHISAYEVKHSAPDGNDRIITFLDTPGHAAFSGHRQRGVQIADIAILVVSAEDGVKPQTLEALNAIKSANIPYIVAINKIDRPAANVEKTKGNLSENGIYIEGYGGDIPAVPISAKTGEGIPELLDMVNLVADLGDFKGEPEKLATGYVLESTLDTKKGVTATLIIKNGTLSRGLFVAAGTSLAPVRMMENFLGKTIETASFSSPIRIIGWDSLPDIGSVFQTFKTKNEALEYVLTLKEKQKTKSAKSSISGATEEQATLPVVLKADVSGSLEAAEKEILKLSTDKVIVKIVNSGIGLISENDIRSAEGNNKSTIIGFNTKADSTAQSYADRNGIPIHTFDIIYKLTEWFEDVVKERTPKILVEEIIGRAKILKVFSQTKDKQIVGGVVETGLLKSGAQVRLLRRESEIGQGKIRELQSKKDRVAEVQEGTECGMQIECPVQIAPGDRIEATEMISK